MEATIDRLQIEISSSASNASASLTRLQSSLKRLQSVTSTSEGALRQLAVSLAALQTASSQLSSLSGLDKIAQSLENLKGKTSGLNSLRRALENLDTANLTNVANGLGALSAAAEGLSHLGDGLESIREFRQGITSLSGSLERLNEMDLSGTADKVNELVAAIKPLTDEMIRAGSGISNFGTQMRDLSQAMRTANNTGRLTNEVRQNLNGLNRTMNNTFSIAKLTAGFFALRKAANLTADAIEEMNSYIEDVNLFTVSMGELAEAGAEFAQKMQDVLGINAGEAMRNMGLFYNLTESFGVASNQAEILSKNMTQLGYDFSSFFNLSIEESFTKLQAAISGELEPIRRLGVDISQTRLQQELYNLGINESVSNLSQADKSILRYIAIMKQSGNAMGDFARTLNTPANMLRVFQAQITLAARAIGSLFIPALTAILPVAIAVVKVITTLVSTLAGLFGFEMPEINWDTDAAASFGTGLEDVSSGLDDVAGSAANAKEQVAYLIGGFDELNVLSSPSSTGGGSGSGAAGGMGDLLSGIELPEYDMFASLVDSDVQKWVERIERIFDSLGEVLNRVYQRSQQLANLFRAGFSVEIGKFGFEELLYDLDVIGQRMQDIFGDSQVANSFDRMLNRLAISAGKTAGSFTRIGLTIVQNLVGGISQYLVKNSGYIKERLIGIFDITGDLGTLISDVSSAFSDIFSVFGGDAAQGITADIIEIFSNGFLGALELAVNFANDIAEALFSPLLDHSDMFQETIENMILKPSETAANAIASFVTNTSKTILDVYKEYVKPAFEAIGDGWSEIWSTVLNTYNSYFAPVFDDLSQKFSNLITNDVQPMVAQFLELFGKIIEIISLLWNDIAVPFVQWITKNCVPAISEGIYRIGNIFTSFFSSASQIITGLLEMLNGILDFLIGTFTGDWSRAWDGVKKIFKEGFADSLAVIFKIAINEVINVINGAIRSVFNGINNLIRNVNKIGDIIGLSIPTVTIPQIPKLANGAVIEPNNPFIAVLGDQKQGKNIEAPESLIRELIQDEVFSAFENHSANYQNEGNGEFVSVIVQIGQAIVTAIEENRETTVVIGRDTVGRAAVGYMQEQKKRTGKALA